MCYFCLVPRDLTETCRETEKQLTQPRHIILSQSEYTVIFHPGLARTEIGYSRSNSTKFAALGVGKFGQPTLMSQVGRVRESVCA